jgi:hypothetical protein
MGSRARPLLVLLPALACGPDPNHLLGDDPVPRRSGGSSSQGGGNDDGSGFAIPSGLTVVKASGSTPAEICVNTINEYRAKDGLSPLKRWTDAESCTDDQAKSDAQTGAGHGAFGRCGEMAQNECPDAPAAVAAAVPRCLALMWAEGPGGGHHDNMAGTQYTKVSCGVFSTSHGTIWSVQNFR